MKQHYFRLLLFSTTMVMAMRSLLSCRSRVRLNPTTPKRIVTATPEIHKNEEGMSRMLRRESQILRTGRNYFSTSNSINQHYDVLIVGGGVVGSTLANLVSQSCDGLKIGLIEPRRPPPLTAFTVDEDERNKAPMARSYALSPASLQMLGPQMDLLQTMGRIGEYRKMQVWESDGPATLRFTHHDLESTEFSSQNRLGAMVEDAPLVSALWDDLSKKHNVDLISPALVQSVSAPGPSSITGSSTPPPLATVTYQDSSKTNQTISTNLLVGADGGNSKVRQSLGMSTMGFGYDRKAVTCTVLLEGSMHHTAYQRFLPAGPIALLPQWNEEEGKWFANIVWSTTPSHAAELQALSSADFVHAVNDVLQHGPVPNPMPISIKEQRNPLEHLAYGINMLAQSANTGLTMMNWTERPPEEAFFCLPPLVAKVEGGRFGFDLQFQQARSYVQPRVALVGDAAHTVHPMAGQGLNLGLADVDCLFHTIKESYQSGMEVGNTMLFLDRYNSTRQAHVGVTMGGIHALHMAFGLSSETTSSTWWAPPGIFARSLGMNLVNSVGPIRKRLAAVAAGAKFQ